MRIQLSDHFTYRKLLRFTLPSIAMMIFTSIYGVVDGYFVSNFVGKSEFAALNLIWPFVMILGTVGFMLGTGGSALVSKNMGEGEGETANRRFSLFVYISIFTGIVIALLGIFTIRPIAALLGADETLIDHCVLYGRILLVGMPCFMLQQEFQSFFVTAEKPQLGFLVTVFAGVTNMVLDALFVAVFGWRLAGAAGATILSQTVGGVVPVIYFLCPNSSRLRLTKTRFEFRALLRACTNGSSELMSNVSMSLVSMLYNLQLLHYAGPDGVSAYGVLMYVNFVFISAFIGYSIGTAPLIGFHYGAGNRGELKNLLRKSLLLIGICSLGMLFAAEALAKPLSLLFVGYDDALLELTLRAFRLFSFSFLFAGVAIYGSSFFTALNNGLVSAMISFLRTLVFQIAAVLILPLWLGIDGIWVSVVAAECMAFAVTLIFIAARKKRYGY